MIATRSEACTRASPECRRSGASCCSASRSATRISLMSTPTGMTCKRCSRTSRSGWTSTATLSAFADEAYADTRHWGVEGSELGDRRRALEQYLFHLLELARSGKEHSAVAHDVLQRKFMPFGNAIWRARGGEKFAFAAGAGNTILDDVQMRAFVSEQVHAHPPLRRAP